MSYVEQLVQGESSINVDYVIFILNNYKLLITLILTTMAFSLSPPPPHSELVESGSQRTDSCQAPPHLLIPPSVSGLNGAGAYRTIKPTACKGFPCFLGFFFALYTSSL